MFRLLKCEHLHFFSVLLCIEHIWAVGWTKQTIQRCNFWCQNIIFGHVIDIEAVIRCALIMDLPQVRLRVQQQFLMKG